MIKFPKNAIAQEQSNTTTPSPQTSPKSKKSTIIESLNLSFHQHSPVQSSKSPHEQKNHLPLRRQHSKSIIPKSQSLDDIAKKSLQNLTSRKTYKSSSEYSVQDNLNKNSSNPYRNKKINFDNIDLSSEVYQAFRIYTENQKCSENLYFLVELQNVNFSDPIEKIKGPLISIIEKFIVADNNDNSKIEINIEGSIRTKILDSYKKINKDEDFKQLIDNLLLAKTEVKMQLHEIFWNFVK